MTLGPWPKYPRVTIFAGFPASIVVRLFHMGSNVGFNSSKTSDNCIRVLFEHNNEFLDN